MLPPKRFKQNTTKATEIKRNGTEAIGIDQDGIAKSIDIEVLMTKDNVGLGDVDNTSDADKPVSIAQRNAINELAGTGRTTETVKGNADAIEPIIEDVANHETRLDTTELALARHDQDLASVKQTLQQGNGATLDFDDIGIVPLDARATGRANPTVEGRTATNLVVNGDFSDGLTGWDMSGGTLSISQPNIIACTADGTAKLAQILPLGGYPTRPQESWYFRGKVRVTNGDCLSMQLNKQEYFNGTFIRTTDSTITTSPVINEWYYFSFVFTTTTNTDFNELVFRISQVYVDPATALGKVIELDGNYGVSAINLTQTFGVGNEPDLETCQKIFSYFDGTKSIQLPARIISKSEDETESSTLYIADDSKLRSFGAITDLVEVVNGEFVLEKNVNDDATAVISPPITTPLLTSGILQAKPKGTVYYEPYYEGSHQTNASSQITLPYTGTIDKLTGYDENLDPYEVPSTAYTLVGTTLTVTGAVENEVFYVELSRAEPLAPEMSVNVLNNDRVLLNPTNGKFYDYTIGVSGADGALIPEFIFTEVE